MTALLLLTALVAAFILTILLFAPFEPIDEEIRDALNYESKQEAMRKAIQK